VLESVLEKKKRYKKMNKIRIVYPRVRAYIYYS
jgi:hypothetical protein